MRWVSTRGECPAADLRTALFDGLAPDGGLYLPERIPELPPRFFESLPGASLVDTAAAVLRPFAEEVPSDELAGLVADALDFDVPLVELGDGCRVLELFHGPTLAFKDVGARFLARLMAWFLRDSDDTLTILVATSGDTGSAVGQAFLGVAHTRVVILYPEGKVSPLQEKQFTTLGGNVRALAVDGTFDDCQRLAKEAFADRGLRRSGRLTSANSISIGRLLPQMTYYFHASARLPAGAPPPLFTTPSGNFGNLCAGLMAKRMGLPVAGFVAATNVNDAVPRYLDTGRYEPLPSIRTISNAMDVGDPSNLARILHLYRDDLGALRRDLWGRRYDDDETRAAIREVHDRFGYVLDPHSAVGWLGLRDARKAAGGVVSGILLATAHPAKFREDVEPAIGRKIELPPRLAETLARDSRARRIPAEIDALREHLAAGGNGRGGTSRPRPSPTRSDERA